MTQPSTDNLRSNSSTTEAPTHLERVSNGGIPGLQRKILSNNLESFGRSQQKQSQLSLKSKVRSWAIALTMLPVITVGVASYLGSQSITGQINQAKPSATELQQAEQALNNYRSSLLLGTGIIAVAAGAIAAFISNRVTRPVLSAAETSTVLVNRLCRREEIETQVDDTAKDELVALKANINLLQNHLPDLLLKQETEAERSHLLVNITRRMWEALSEEDVLRTTVEEVRQALRIDRVVIFRFDSDWGGTFIEEAAAPGLPKILWATVSDPCFQEKYIEQYQQGRVRAIHNIYQANLTDCHIGLLERFAVKANLIAPIIKKNQLFGLLIGHQCSAPREWQQAEIDLFAQIGTQLGFALDHARLVEQIDIRADQAHVVINITRRIRQSLNEEDVLKNTVDEIRKALSADRVMIYGFDADWYGTVIAEAVVPGFPKALRARIKDPCFVEGYVEQYRAGRVQATNDVYKAGLSACHISQLEPFAVKANLVAPILKDDQLFGLLIAHQCSAPREWQKSEIDLVAQLAMQVGFALDHARLLDKVEQAYESVESAFQQQYQQKETLQSHASELLRDSETIVETLSHYALSQMDAVTDTYEQIQALINMAQEMICCIQELETQEQQISNQLELGQQGINRVLDNISTIRSTVVEATTRLKRFDLPSQTLVEKVNLIAEMASQIKRNAMKVVFESVRTGEAEHNNSTVEGVLSLAQQLDADIAGMKSLITETHITNNEVTALMEVGQQQALAAIGEVEQTQHKLAHINTLSTQVNTLIGELIQVATNQAEISSTASRFILEVASNSQQTNEQATKVAESLAKLTAIAHNQPDSQ